MLSKMHAHWRVLDLSGIQQFLARFRSGPIFMKIIFKFRELFTSPRAFRVLCS